MQIFVHSPIGLVLQDIDEHTSVSDLVKQIGLDDASAWLEDTDEPLDPTNVLTNVANDNDHIHLNRCHRVEVTVNFAGKEKSRKFAPGATIQAVRRWAVGPNGFDLPAKEQPKHEVGVCGTGNIAERTDHVGTLAADCSVCLNLAPKDRFQG
jgi:hypothetical protein